MAGPLTRRSRARGAAYRRRRPGVLAVEGDPTSLGPDLYQTLQDHVREWCRGVQHG